MFLIVLDCQFANSLMFCTKSYNHISVKPCSSQIREMVPLKPNISLFLQTARGFEKLPGNLTPCVCLNGLYSIYDLSYATQPYLSQQWTYCFTLNFAFLLFSPWLLVQFYFLEYLSLPLFLMFPSALEVRFFTLLLFCLLSFYFYF